MDRIAVFVGLDYHQDAVQVCVMDGGGRVLSNRSCVNAWEAIVALAEHHGRVVRVGIEACTGSAKALMRSPSDGVSTVPGPMQLQRMPCFT